MEPLLYTPIRRAHVFTGNANPELAQEIAHHLNTELSPRVLEPFSDGEIGCKLGDTVRGSYVFVVQSYGGGDMDPNVALMEQLQLCAAAKGASADKIIAVCPYFGYGRQDRKSQGREPISAELVCRLLRTAGATGLVGVDLHSPQIQGFFAGEPFDNLTAAPLLRDAILPRLRKGVVLVSPDAGRVKATKGHKDRLPPELKARTAYVDKTRPKGTKNHAEVLAVVGNVKDCQCLVIDDMIDSGGTLKASVDALYDRGAKEVLAMATHAVLSGNAVNNLAASNLSQIVVSNTLALTPERAGIGGLQVISVAKLIADAIHAIFTDGSISKLFNEGENHS